MQEAVEFELIRQQACDIERMLRDAVRKSGSAIKTVNEGKRMYDVLQKDHFGLRVQQIKRDAGKGVNANWCLMDC